MDKPTETIARLNAWESGMIKFDNIYPLLMILTTLV